ncbi:ESPR-type extended signal peptide-containing protein, partial [Ignatzschineria cameli]|uniref:ESPR-type extended signal peptide-containing protein n=1 Tax=Ignatzschineria cameli TaxID=2182793 RepID=UPI000D6101E5
MNRVYRVVWCHVRNTYVVASELASRKKIKSKSGSLLKPIILSFAVAFSLGGVAVAATGINGGTGGGTALSPTNNECGRGSNQANAQRKGNIAIGCDAEALDSTNTSMYDRGNPENKIDTKSYFASIAIGERAKANQAGVSIGTGTESSELGVAFGSQARSRGIAAVAIGAAALSTGNTSLALGRQSAATGDFAQAIGNVSIAEGKGSLAMGHSATARGNRSIAIGSADIDNAGSTGNQQGTVYQTQQQTLSTGKDSIAIGAAAKAKGDYTLAVGAHAKASGSNSTAMGYDSSATGEDAFAAGRSANAEGQDAFALGANAHGKGVKSFAMGTGSKAIGENALALGSLSVAKEKNSIAVGVDAKANFEDSVALGSGAIVNHDNSISIGTGSTTNDYDVPAFLFEDGVAGAVATGAVSIGNGSGSILEGSESNERRLQNLAAGSLDTDAVNVSQLKKFKTITDKSAEDVAKNLGGGSKYDPNTGDISAPKYTVTNKDGDKTTVNDVGSALETIDGNINQGLTFAGDDGSKKYQLGETVSIIGGADKDALTANNIGVVVDDENGKINVQLAKNLDLGTDGSITTGNTVMNNDGVTVTGDDGEPKTSLGKDGLTITKADGKAGPSVTVNGIDAGGEKITNVADGQDGKDAVNKGQLDDAVKGITDVTDKGLTFAGNQGDVNKKLGETLTIKGGLADDADATAENLRVDVNEKNELVVKMSSNLTGINDLQVGKPGKDGEDGVDGKIGVNGKDGSSVVINGEDGSIGLTGPAGKDGKSPELNISVKDGKPGLDGKDGEVRIVYKDKDGNEKEVASLDDGLQFGADNEDVVVNRKLNTKLDIKGGAEAASADRNIVTTANADGSIQLDLAKDLKLADNEGNAGSITLGKPGADGKDSAKLDGSGLTLTGKDGKPGPSLTQDGINAGDKVIAGVADGTEKDHAVNQGQLEEAKKGLTDAGLKFAGNDADKAITKKLGDTVTIKGGLADDANATAENLRVDVNDDGELVVKMSSKLTGINDLQVGKPGKDGVDGQIGVNGKDGAAVVINGKDGSIGLTGPVGKDGKPGASTTITVINDGKPGVDGKDGETEVRVVYKDKNGDQQQIANLNDGLKFAGDNPDVKGGVKLNEVVNLKGGAEGDLTDNNIGVVADIDEKGMLKSLDVKLAENINLGEKGSVTTGKTVVNNDGVKVGENVTLGDQGLSIKDGPSIKQDGINAGDKVIAGVADGTEKDHAVNQGQLEEAKKGLTDAGLKFAGNDADKAITKKLGDTVTIKGGLADGAEATAENLRVDVNEKNELVIKMSKDLKGLENIVVGSDGKDGKPGVSINGEDGSIGLTGPAGQDGKDAPHLDISVKDGKPGLDGKDGEVRIVYKDKEGNEKEVASLDDGLQFGADNEDVVVNRKLNTKLDIKGGAEAASADRNIVTTANADGSIQLDLAKDLKLADN